MEDPQGLARHETLAAAAERRLEELRPLLDLTDALGERRGPKRK
jgi:hypothetical protein